MSDIAASIPVGLDQPALRAYPVAGLRFQWASALLSAWLVGGLYLDGWAHAHGRVDDVFFTPWHAVLYSGVFVAFLFLLANLVLNHARGYAWRRALPQGYGLSLAGAALFLAGGGLDLAWHRVFGIEVNIETLLSPTHLLLATSGVLLIGGGLRSAWVQARLVQPLRGWVRLGPAILVVSLLLSVFTFFTQFSNPLRHVAAQKDPFLSAIFYSDLYVLNADGSAQTRLTAADGLYSWTADWSPDGKQAVLTRGAPGPDRKPSQLYLINRDGSGLQQLTHLDGQAWTPAWSPDGQRIAFIQAGAGTQQLMVVRADGSNSQALTPASVLAYGPAWSPDGSRLVYTSNLSGLDQLYILSASGGEPRQLTHSGSDNWGVSWSPDGEQIIYHSYREGISGIYAIHPDGSGDTLLASLPGENLTPAWSPDGRQIVFVNNNDGFSNLYAMEANGASPRNLTHNYALEFTFPRWSPDGARILVTATGHNTQAPEASTQSTSISGILLLAALLAGCALLLLKNWALPFGALTLMFGLNAALMSVLGDTYWLIPAALLAGLGGDLLLAWLKPAPSRPGRLRLFAFALPVLYFSLYFLAVQLNGGIDWKIHLWLGAVFMAGIAGLLASLLLTRGLAGPEA